MPQAPPQGFIGTPAARPSYQPAPNLPQVPSGFATYPAGWNQPVASPQAGAPKRLSSEDFAELALPTIDGLGAAQDAIPNTPNAPGAGQPEQISPEVLGGGLLDDTESLPRPSAAPLPGKASSGFDPLDVLPPSLFGNVDRDALPDTQSPAPTGNSPSAQKWPESADAKKTQAHDQLPSFFEPYGTGKGPQIDALTQQVPFDASAFSPAPYPNASLNPHAEGAVYRGKHAVPVQRPLLELWRPLYTGGLYPPEKHWLGEYNPMIPHFMVYGDFRTAVGVNKNIGGDNRAWAQRLNLDMDLKLTGTERIHGFVGPLDRGGDYTRLDFTNDVEFVDRTDIRVDNLFFEGDVGSIMGGFAGHDSSFDLPIAAGFMPFFYQNGVWAADNAIGAALAIPSQNSKLLKWSNYDATFFWASDQINTDAFPGDNTAAEFFGTAWFIDAYDGYIEVDYAFVHDDSGQHLSYHNFSVAYGRRYFHKISNTVRFIANFNQSLPSDQRTADGHLLLIENSLISASPNTFVPYMNFFYGQGRTQSLARAGGAGGILNNTGINFESDGLTAYPTLDPTAVNTVGGALGFNILGQNFDKQLILEVAALSANGSQQFRNAAGDQVALGVRYQLPLNNHVILRADSMVGFLRNSRDIQGNRVELRWKF